MKKNNYLLVVCVICFFVAIFAPIFALFELEDRKRYLNSISLNMIQEGNKSSDNAIINTIYARYNNIKYNVSISDEYEYSVPNMVIDGEHYINESLVNLKELEAIGLIKSDFF